MLYCWKNLENFPNAHYAAYDDVLSPDRFILQRGKSISIEEYGRCDAYLRSEPIIDLADDPFIRLVVRRKFCTSYIFAPQEMYYCACGNVTRININQLDLQKLKNEMPFSPSDVDKDPIPLSDQDLALIAATEGCPNILVTEEIKQAFDTAKVRGVLLITPEEYYRPIRREDIVD